jgi:hypothetical protein
MGFYRDVLRAYAGMRSRLAWQELPDSLIRVVTDGDGQGTDLGVFLFLADLLTLREVGCLILWLGFPRKDGDRNDCHAVFSRLAREGMTHPSSPTCTWRPWRAAPAVDEAVEPIG